MKLFVWVDPYQVSYGSSLLFAVAETVEEAKELALSSRADAYSYGQYARPNPGVALGEPERIVDLPCAEWHVWSE